MAPAAASVAAVVEPTGEAATAVSAEVEGTVVLSASVASVVATALS